jgi:predicted DNA binding CopG/RHH family protein
MKKIPTFKNQAEEVKFWQTNDSNEYIDWNKAKLATFPNLKPSSETISLRLPVSLLNELKTIAHKQDVPYQSLIKIILAQKIKFLRSLEMAP